MITEIIDEDNKSGIKTIAVEPEKYFTCQHCHKDFKSDSDKEIIPGVKPTCSRNCDFKLLFHFIKREYSRTEIKIIWKGLSPYEKVPEDENDTIYKITKGVI